MTCPQVGTPATLTDTHVAPARPLFLERVWRGLVPGGGHTGRVNGDNSQWLWDAWAQTARVAGDFTGVSVTLEARVGTAGWLLGARRGV